MTKLKAGDKAPEFQLPDQTGTTHSLKEYKGKFVVLYFYPKDDTTGCTKEACGIRDNFPKFGKVNAVVLGVSVDSPESHAKFVKKYKLPFTLLADTEKKVVNAYGVWGKKQFMGRTYDGTFRATFIIDPNGKIAKVYEKVKPEEHAEELLRDLATMKV